MNEALRFAIVSQLNYTTCTCMGLDFVFALSRPDQEVLGIIRNQMEPQESKLKKLQLNGISVILMWQPIRTCKHNSAMSSLHYYAVTCMQNSIIITSGVFCFSMHIYLEITH